MRNRQIWRPSKFVFRGQAFAGSRDAARLYVASRLTADRIAAAYQRYLPRFCHGKLLDLGCGNVPLYAIYREFVDATICIDWAATGYGMRYADVECDLSQPLPFSNGVFHTAIPADVHQRIPTPDALLTEISRVLRPGGVFVITVPFLYWLQDLPNDYFRYTEFGLGQLIGRANLNLVLIEPLGG